MVPMILPKGIVLNHSHIYGEIASYPIVPEKKIWQYWNVYTTTCRRLQDPTANRLEHFWWHVLGSDRRFLPGRTLAKLFRDIAEEPTFVPLKGPANRYEPPDPNENQAPLVKVDPSPSSQIAVSSNSGTSSQGCRSNIVPSSAKPPPAHPILKKARGPSASGPRPTARFASPPGSEDEQGGNDDASSGGTTINSNLEEKDAKAGGSKRTAKKLKGSGKKKVVPVASKRRPALGRRTSSQITSNSTAPNPSAILKLDSGVKEDKKKDKNQNQQKVSAAQKSLSPISQQPALTTEGTANVDQNGGIGRLSNKAAGKRPAIGALSNDNTASSPNDQEAQITNLTKSHKELSGEAIPPSCNNVEESGSMAKENNRAFEVQRNKQRGLPAHRRSDAHERVRPVVPTMNRSKSDTGSHSVMLFPGKKSVPAAALMSSSPATRLDVSAQELLEKSARMEAAKSVSTLPETSEVIQPSFRRSSGHSASNSIDILGRTKTQLTRLLERDEEKKPQR